MGRDVLLDTHALVWWLMGDARMSRAARAAVEGARRRGVSVVVPIELTYLAERRQTQDLAPFLDGFERDVTGAGFELLPLRYGDVAALRGLPWHHKDPFDRLMLAQACHHGLALVTADGLMRAYEGITCVW